jgi:hypothetical protein
MPDLRNENRVKLPYPIKNCSPLNLDLKQNDFIGCVENVQDCETQEINPAYLQAVAQQCKARQS